MVNMQSAYWKTAFINHTKPKKRNPFLMKFVFTLALKMKSPSQCRKFQLKLQQTKRDEFGVVNK